MNNPRNKKMWLKIIFMKFFRTKIDGHTTWSDQVGQPVQVSVQPEKKGTEIDEDGDGIMDGLDFDGDGDEVVRAPSKTDTTILHQEFGRRFGCVIIGGCPHHTFMIFS